jgi:hypothetical protein
MAANPVKQPNNVNADCSQLPARGRYPCSPTGWARSRLAAARIHRQLPAGRPNSWINSTSKKSRENLALREPKISRRTRSRSDEVPQGHQVRDRAARGNDPGGMGGALACRGGLSLNGARPACLPLSLPPSSPDVESPNVLSAPNRRGGKSTSSRNELPKMHFANSYVGSGWRKPAAFNKACTFARGRPKFARIAVSSISQAKEWAETLSAANAIAFPR